jgi:hypothetical protein
MKTHEEAMRDERPSDQPTGTAPGISTDAKDFFMPNGEEWGERDTATYEQGQEKPIEKE